jgi:hypothetical protein
MATPLRQYDTVACNGLPDATVYRVTEVNGRMVGITDASCSHPNQAIQWIDRSMVQRATIAQLQHAGLIE